MLHSLTRFPSNAHPDIAFAAISHLIIPFSIFHILLQKYLCYVIKISLISFFSFSARLSIILILLLLLIFSLLSMFISRRQIRHIPEQLMSMLDASPLRVVVRWHIFSGVILRRKYMSLRTSFLSNKTYSY